MCYERELFYQVSTSNAFKEIPYISQLAPAYSPLHLCVSVFYDCNYSSLFCYCILIAYLVQKKRDQFCNDEMHSHACLYYARLGYDGSGKKPKLGCFCESSLTNDGNYHSNSLGDYTLDGNLAKIVDY